MLLELAISFASNLVNKIINLMSMYISSFNSEKSEDSCPNIANIWKSIFPGSPGNQAVSNSNLLLKYRDNWPDTQATLLLLY